MTANALEGLTLDQKLDTIHHELERLASAVTALAALKAARDDTAEHMNTAAHALMARNERRARGEACPECQDTSMVLDALGAIPCPVCSQPCIRSVGDHPSDAAQRDPS